MTNLFFLLTPFSYLEVGNVRLIIFQMVLGFLVVLFSLLRRPLFYESASFWVSLVLICLSASYAVGTGYYKDLSSTVAFCILLYSSFFMVSHGKISVERVKNIYVVSCIFVSLGLIFQFLASKFLGAEVFRQAVYGGNRSAYSFIWTDFSFVSLFVVSCLPVLLSYRNKLLVLSSSIIVLFASVITSARTGVAAIFLFFSLFLIWKFIGALINRRILRKYVFFILPVLTLPLAFLYFLPLLTGRRLTLSTSGRLDGFFAGLDYFSTHPLTGALLNKDLYVDVVTVVPHNFFLFPLFMGGVVYFFVFIMFVLSLALDVRTADKDILAMLLICFFGLQFIPSFFSAYFLAILLGAAMASSRMNRCAALKGC